MTEIAEQLALDGNGLHPWDAAKERDRIQVWLRHLRLRGLAVSTKVTGDRRLRWSVTNREWGPAATAQGGARDGGRRRLTDRDWALIKRVLPPHGRRSEAEAASRRFIEDVLNDVTLEQATGLTPGQIRRFWSWQDFGVWQAIGNSLGHKLSAEEVERLAKKLAILVDDYEAS